MHYKWLHPKYPYPTVKDRILGPITLPATPRKFKDQGQIPEEAYLPKWWKPFKD